MISQRSDAAVIAIALLQLTKGLRMTLISWLIQMSIPILGFFYKPKPWPHSLDKMRSMEVGTLGRTIASWLDKCGLQLIPKYETHDVKHVLAGYPMTSLGEIRLQAFLYGNGSRSLPTLGVFAIGLVLLPEHWSTFMADLKRGTYCEPLHKQDLASLVPQNLKAIKNQLGL
ncbi:MAG: hypothetical protein AAF502_09155 [Bacteroidota bacterium]